MTPRISLDQIDPNHAISIFTYAYTSGVAIAILLFGPLIIGTYVQFEGMTETQAGYLFSVEMAGYALSSLIVFAILQHINWRYIVLAGVLIMVVANLVAILLHDYVALITVRMFAGLGAGVLMNMTMVSIGLTRNPDRGYGFWTVAQLAIGAAGLFVLPELIPRFGLLAPFLLIAILGISLLPLVFRFPRGGRTASGARGHRKSLLLGLSGLAGIFVYYAGQSAVWTYLERIGVAAGLTPTTIGTALSMSILLAIFSALLATWLANRLGRRAPIMASMICSTLAICMLWNVQSSLDYLLAICAFNAGWYFCLPYITAMIAAVDTNGRLIVSLAVVYPASLAGGPALATALLNGFGYGPVLWLGILSLPLGLSIMWKVAGTSEED